MKKHLLFILILGCTLVSLAAQATKEEENDDKKVSAKFEININEDPINELSTYNKPYMGIRHKDITLPKAKELNYNGYAGILIVDVIPGSPAWQHHLQEEDILFCVDGKEITDSATFHKIIKNYSAGDKVILGIFRDGKTNEVEFTFGSRNKTELKIEEKTCKNKSAGYRGITWLPMFVFLDMEDVNNLIASDTLSFGKLNEDGSLQQGIAGKFSIGKGFFLGGQYSSYKDVKKHHNQTNPEYQLWMKYKNQMGGVTLDKRIPITKNFISSAGLMVGGAKQIMEFQNSNSNFNWDSLPSTITHSNNTHFEITKGYLTVQPRFELMYRFLPWLALRAEIGYTYSYNLTNYWKVTNIDGDPVEIKGSPDTNFQGLTLSIGPWLGF